MQDFTNETIDLNQLPKYQDIILNTPNKKYWSIIVINISISLLLVGIGLITLLILNKESRPYLYSIIGGYLVIGILIFLLHAASFKKRGFALREKDIVYKSGIIAESTSIIPINRIQHVALNEGIFSRMYKLATLQISTASGGSGQMNIAGIPIEKAKVIKEALVQRLDLLEKTEEQV